MQIETLAIGYGVAVASQIAILPLFGVHLPLADNLAIGGYFTVISHIIKRELPRALRRMRAETAKQPEQTA